MNIIVLDAEIRKKVLGKDEVKDPALEYCAGWHDFSGMGLSVGCAYDYSTGRYRVFLSDNLGELQVLINKAEFVVGFGSKHFDSKLLAANGVIIPPEKHFDILEEMWKAAGLGVEYVSDTHSGYGLGVTAEANIDGLGKTGDGALAPDLWQQGRLGELIDYCLSDGFVTKKLMDAILVTAGLWSPKDDGQWLPIFPPASKRGRETSRGCDVEPCLKCGRDFQGSRCPKCGTCRS